MRLNRLAVLLAVASCSAAIAPSAWAQDSRRAELAQRYALKQLAAEQANQDKVLVSVDFPGGTLTEWVVALTQAAKPEPANIILRGDAERIPIAPTKLDNVPLSAALEVVSGDYPLQDNTFYRVSTKEFQEAAGRSVFSMEIINIGSRAPRSPHQPAPRDIIVLQIKELTTAMPGDPPEVVVPAETVLTAIETVLEVAEDDGKTDMKYHSASGLIMLAGPVSSLKAAEEVVKQMWNDVVTRRDRARMLQNSQGLDRPEFLERDLAEAVAELEMARVQMLVASEQYEVAAESLEEAEKLQAEGFVSEGEVNATRLRLIESKADIERGRIQAELQQQTVEQLKRSLERARAIATGGDTSDEISALRDENTMLRDRLAAMEAELAKLREFFAAQPIVTKPGKSGR